MNYLEDLRTQTEAMHICVDDAQRWRGILVNAVLLVSKPGKVLGVMQKVDPTAFQAKSRATAVASIRSMLKVTRSKMGLHVELPVSQTRKQNPKKNRPGKPTDVQLEEYRLAHCVPWIKKNGGLPRFEQLSDPMWDLKPFPAPPAPSMTAKPLPQATVTKHAAVAVTLEKSEMAPLSDSKPPGDPYPPEPIYEGETLSNFYDPEQQAQLDALQRNAKGDIIIPTEQLNDSSPASIRKRLASNRRTKIQ